MAVQKVAHLFSILKHAPLQNIVTCATLSKDIQLSVKRDDLIHPIISGNKWRKLKHVLLDIELKGFKKIAVMGGMYSNLLHTVSYIGMLLGWQVELYVRGYKEQKLSPMLIDAIKWGAKINYIDRAQYRDIRELPPRLAKDVFWIAEGGHAQLALKGSIESLMELPQVYDYLVIASATGTSLAGYCQGVAKLSLDTKVIGVAVLNNENEIIKNLNTITHGVTEPEIIKDYTFGGYAKTNGELEQFIIDVEKKHQIPLEPVYSGKAFFAVMDLIKEDFFPRGSKVLLVHCGGLQGTRQ